MSDEISNLPVDKTAINTPQELKVLSYYFQNTESRRQLMDEIKDIAIASIVFLLIANPLTDYIFEFIPHMDSPLIRTLAKTIIFAIFLYMATLMTK
jgi:hypothetical protein